MNPDAMPFYPTHLKQLFDTLQYPVGYGPAVPVPTWPMLNIDLANYVHAPPPDMFQGSPEALKAEFNRTWQALFLILIQTLTMILTIIQY